MFEGNKKRERCTIQRTSTPKWNMVEGVLWYGGASMHLELGISTRWKEWMNKEGYVRFWKKTTNSNKTGSVLLLCLPTRRKPQTCVSPGQELPQEDQRKCYWLDCQNPYLNPIKNLWGELKTKVHARPSNPEELEIWMGSKCSGDVCRTCWKL